MCIKGKPPSLQFFCSLYVFFCHIGPYQELDLDKPRTLLYVHSYTLTLDHRKQNKTHRSSNTKSAVTIIFTVRSKDQKGLREHTCTKITFGLMVIWESHFQLLFTHAHLRTVEAFPLILPQLLHISSDSWLAQIHWLVLMTGVPEMSDRQLHICNLHAK